MLDQLIDDVEKRVRELLQNEEKLRQRVRELEAEKNQTLIERNQLEDRLREVLSALPASVPGSALGSATGAAAGSATGIGTGSPIAPNEPFREVSPGRSPDEEPIYSVGDTNLHDDAS